MRDEDIKVVADFLYRAVQLSLLLQKEAGSKLLKDFVRVATTAAEGNQGYLQVKQLRDDCCLFQQVASPWRRRVDAPKAHWSPRVLNRALAPCPLFWFLCWCLWVEVRDGEDSTIIFLK
jgi:hypothetical protein